VRLSERTIAGLEKARAKGRIGGRPKVADNPKTANAVRKMRAEGQTIREIAAKVGISTNSVMSVLKKEEASNGTV
jgi:DNA invertase Pin-like site-specific DNA recombinase